MNLFHRRYNLDESSLSWRPKLRPFQIHRMAIFSLLLPSFLLALSVEAWNTPLSSSNHVLVLRDSIKPKSRESLLTHCSVVAPDHSEESARANSGQLDNDEDTTVEPATFSFRIRPCQYADLNVVSDIIMDSFYEDKTAWRRLTQIAELNRLQQNFPYVDVDLHQMLVATTTTTNGEKDTVIAFVDVDARPCKTEIRLPRPYLSDLAVHPDYRRKGTARALVQACEDFVRNIPPDATAKEISSTELWIRVEESNEAAISMYVNHLGYEPKGNVETTRDKKRVMTLYKSFAD